MNGQTLTFITQVLELEEIGQNTLVEVDEYDAGQVSRGLYWHGKQSGKKFSYMKTPNGYLITLVGFRNKDSEDDCGFSQSKGFIGLGKVKPPSDGKFKQFKEASPKGTTHHYQGRYLKNIRTFNPRSEKSEYSYAYDFWDGVKWRWVACKREDFLKIKPL